MPEVARQVSFRDPDGFVLHADNRIFRIVLPHLHTDFREFLASEFATDCMASGTLSSTRVVSKSDDDEGLPDVPDGSLLLEHRPVRFPSYPYEWSPAMLHAAAGLTLEMAQTAHGAGYRLKDATPYNIMFEGANPVFIDILSFRPNDALDPLWRPYAQFVRTFIYPLLANRYFDLRLNETMLVNRDGLEPRRVMRLCSPLRLLRPPFLGSVTIPALLSSRKASPDRYRPRLARDVGEAEFLQKRLLTRAERLLHRVRPPSPKKAAVRYIQADHNYTPPEMAAKARLIGRFFDSRRPESVLDIGCNTGHFSQLAATGGASVVAIDRDPNVIDDLWSTTFREGLNVLPAVVDIARPSPACGWANRECSSFLDRARGKFDCVLMLALIHHLIVTERIPPDRIFELLADLTTDSALVEYVDPADLQFERIARGREALYSKLTPTAFEAAARGYFDILDQHPIAPHRRIYTLQKKRNTQTK